MKKHRILFLLCWIAYFSTYIGRQNYTASMSEIIAAEGYLNRTCGLVGTGFFITYGVGQIISGFLGDRFHPKWMIFTGIFLSSLSNLSMAFLTTPEAMTAVWCVNGAAQSMTWSPLLRIFAEYLPEEEQKTACVNIATTYPAAVFLIYPLCSFLIYISGWKMVFLVSGGFMAAVSALWILGFTRLERLYPEGERSYSRKTLDEYGTMGQDFRFTGSLVLLLSLAGFLLTVQGALRDGVTGWVPSYLSNTYQVGTFIAIFATAFLPFINLFGVYFANLIYRKGKKNELETTMILFVISLFSIFCLIVFEGMSLFLSLFFFAVTTSCMMGINVMLVSFIPSYFIRFGKVSTISGLLNSTVYIGSSIATYGLGALADTAGWSFILKFLCAVAGAGVLGSLICIPRWGKFLKENG
ncbi:MAG: MFS transporter [Lacrimispora sp.]|uniref:MFS transporter n=1 Tax=Lacrimispora sp. TaxID=2719234 RepID=UPI0039E66803